MFLGAGLVFSGCGDDDTATTPAPAPPPPPAPEPEPEPEPPAPEAPATPTGLHVDETTETTIEWHWNAVEGAIGYAVQVSMDEMFDATDKIVPTVETHYTESDLEPMTSVYLRVAAAAGTLEAPILSDWSTHVTGMSAMPPPPPPPPAPDPVSVTFTVGEDDGFPMKPDEDDDKDTAMASVNEKMVVSSNTTAVITPMFVENANAVSVSVGDNNMPFAYVNWKALQSDVVDGGVTFMIQRTAMGANQEMEPTGDVAYVACGPFECVTGDNADVTSPEVTSMDDESYANWDPVLDVTWGWVDNDVYDDAGSTTSTTVTDDGIELGWVTTSTLGMTVKHIFQGVSNGRNFEVAGPDAAGDQKKDKGKARSLKMTRADNVNTAADEAISLDPTSDDYKYGTSGLPALTVRTTGAGDNPPNTECIPASVANSRYSYDTTGETFGTAGTKGLLQPDDCFKIDAKPDWLSGYSVEFTPKNDGVKWAKNIDWFEDLEYESRIFSASDYSADICDMLFEEEVDRAMDAKWTRTSFDTRDTDAIDTTGSGNNGGNHYITAWRIGPVLDNPDTTNDVEGLKARQFKTLWFDDDLDGDFKLKAKDKNPSPYRPMGANDLYGPDAGFAETPTFGARTTGNVNQIWQMVVDEDNDPTSDFGKIDLVSAKDDVTTADNETTRELEACNPGVAWGATTEAHMGLTDANREKYGGGCGLTFNTDGSVKDKGAAAAGRTVAVAHPDGVADNMTGAQKDVNECTTDDNGDDQTKACDAELVLDFDLRFIDGTFGCDTERPITVTCTWDSSADTDIGNTTDGTSGTEFTAANARVGAKCEVEVN